MNEQEERLLKQLSSIDGHRVVVDFDDFKNFVMSGKDVLTEVIWKFKDDKLCYQRMCPANVALLIQSIDIDSAGWIGFEGFMLEVNHRMLESFFTDLESSKKLIIRFKAENDKQVRVTLEGGFGSVDFFATIPSDDWPKVPGCALSTKVRIGKNDFMALIAQAYTVAESVTLQVKESMFNMMANGDLLMNLRMPQSYTVAQSSGPDAKAKFSIEYLKRIRLSGDFLTLSFTTNNILRIDDDEGNSFLLAPRVDSDDSL